MIHAQDLPSASSEGFQIVKEFWQGPRGPVRDEDGDPIAGVCMSQNDAAWLANRINGAIDKAIKMVPQLSHEVSEVEVERLVAVYWEGEAPSALDRRNTEYIVRSTLKAHHSALEAEIERLKEEKQTVEFHYDKAITALREQLRIAREALQRQSCSCKVKLVTSCPQCFGILIAVSNDSKYLNDDQFASIRAGDFYCTTCAGVEAKSGHKYWWNADLISTTLQCGRCAALASLGEK